MTEDIKKIPLVVGDGKDIRTLFDELDARYVIPLYQRAFAWGTEKYSNRENEIVQLMDDIMDVRNDTAYYLGSLIVAKRGGEFEVIDGQQRLTALFLLFHCLGLKVKKEGALSYACRETSNYAMRRIDDLIVDESRLDHPYEQSIYEGVKTIQKTIASHQKETPDYCDKMMAALKRVVLFRICVPVGTDLNRYFEIMNTRGEQLEQHDIVKAMLMRSLSEGERAIFAEVWNACRDMTGYVQMHFSMERRVQLFGGYWADLPSLKTLTLSKRQSNIHGRQLTITQVVSPSFKVDETDGVTDNNDRIRFESIIEFTHFLLHVLKVFIRSKELVSSTPDQPLVDSLLDDKKLISSFEKVMRLGVVNGEMMSDHDFAWAFLDCLLRCRFLFDKYIIKREYGEEDVDGDWSLQELRVSANRPYYVKTEFREYYERRLTSEYRKDRNRMIQACLRVSYTSPKVMHWITELLWWLYKDNCNNLSSLASYSTEAEKLASAGVYDFVYSESHDWGVNTPHVVFNFLDYLLWRDHWDGKGEPFNFEFRNSVEHWYPQHPSDGMFGEMERAHRFGNLCLIQSKVNARFSNLSPDSKKASYEDMVNKGSLKLRLMAKLTVSMGDKKPPVVWRDENCKIHEDEMLDILREAVPVKDGEA